MELINWMKPGKQQLLQTNKKQKNKTMVVYVTGIFQTTIFLNVIPRLVFVFRDNLKGSIHPFYFVLSCHIQRVFILVFNSLIKDESLQLQFHLPQWYSKFYDSYVNFLSEWNSLSISNRILIFLLVELTDYLPCFPLHALSLNLNLHFFLPIIFISTIFLKNVWNQ